MYLLIIELTLGFYSFSFINSNIIAEHSKADDVLKKYYN